MTVETNDTVERYTVSGVGPYAFSFRIFAETDLAVTAINSASVTVLTYLTHYTVADANDPDGGSITLTSGTETTYDGYTLDIRTNTPNEQETSIRNLGRFLPEIHEDAFDNLARQIQDLARRQGQSVQAPDYEPALSMSLPRVSERAGKYLVFNDSGLPRVAEGAPSDLTADAAQFGATGDGATDDTVALQNWLDYGGKLTGRGTFRITSRLEITQDNTHVDARGMKFVHDTATIESVIYAQVRSDISWWGGEIDGQKALKSAVGVAQAYGIYFEGCNNAVILRPWVHDCYEHGIRVGEDTTNPAPSTNIQIIAPRCADNGNAANGRGWGIWCFGSIDRLLIVAPICRNNYAGGIFVDDVSGSGVPGHDNLDVIIDSPIVSSTSTTPVATSACIGLSGTRYFAITNPVARGYSHALAIEAGQANTETGFASITGGVLSGIEHAIGIYNCRDITVTGVDLSHFGAEADAQSLVELDSRFVGATNLLKNITVRGCRGRSYTRGVRVGFDAGHTGTNDNIVVESNNLEFVGTGAAPTNRDGVMFNDTTLGISRNNDIKAFYNGTSFNSTAQGRVYGGTARDCVNAGVHVNHGTFNEIVGFSGSDNVEDIEVGSTGNVYTTRLLRNQCYSATPLSGGAATTREGNIGFAGTTETAANIASVAAAINTTAKYVSKEVWDSTNNRKMRASGSAAADPWYGVDGTAPVTPS